MTGIYHSTIIFEADMKKPTILSLFCLALLFFSCTKKAADVTAKTYFEANADGVKVEGDISSKNFKVFANDVDSTAIIATIAGETGLSLEMHLKETGKGTYIVWGNQVQLTTRSANGDIIKQYVAKPTNRNKITITDVDASSNIITGKFNFSLQKNYSANGNIADSVVFTNGKFAVKLP